MSIGKFKTWFKYFALNSNVESRAKTKQTTFSARLIFLEKNLSISLASSLWNSLANVVDASWFIRINKKQRFLLGKTVVKNSLVTFVDALCFWLSHDIVILCLTVWEEMLRKNKWLLFDLRGGGPEVENDYVINGWFLSILRIPYLAILTPAP